MLVTSNLDELFTFGSLQMAKFQAIDEEIKACSEIY